MTGSDDAASLSYPRATRACGLVAMDGRSVDGGASSVGGGPTGNRVGSRSDLVRTPQHLLYAGAASLTRRPMRAVLVELGRDVRHLFYCSGLKGSTSTALLVSPPSSETCGGSMAAAAGARGGYDPPSRKPDVPSWDHHHELPLPLPRNRRTSPRREDSRGVQCWWSPSGRGNRKGAARPFQAPPTPPASAVESVLINF